MKTINVTFEDSEYDNLLKAKGEMNWRDFILTLVKEPKKKNKNELRRF
jgi:predicted CopG family antitoxin